MATMATMALLNGYIQSTVNIIQSNIIHIAHTLWLYMYTDIKDISGCSVSLYLQSSATCVIIHINIGSKCNVFICTLLDFVQAYLSIDFDLISDPSKAKKESEERKKKIGKHIGFSVHTQTQTQTCEHIYLYIHQN